jgi:hypothetical protein
MIPREILFDTATRTAERVVREQNVTSLHVDPCAIAAKLGIEVVPKSPSDGGVSGMLIRVGNDFCIGYATHIKSPGFRRFTIAHELGHYFIEGHVDAVFSDGPVHQSRAGFGSSLQYELEADHFAARLLMPNALFATALKQVGEGLAAVESLAGICITSLTATAIRYAECTHEPVAVVMSSGTTVDFCVMSKALREKDGIDWIRKKQPLPADSATRKFNSDPARVRRAERVEHEAAFQDWFGSPLRLRILEDIIGLGSYGKTLTVLHGIEFLEDSEDPDDDDARFADSWTPRFRK